MSKKPAPRKLTVKSTRRITPNMHEIVFTGEDLKTFPHGQNGAHLKLFIDENEALSRPLLRTYSIRDFKPETLELFVQFAIHEPAGPGLQWVLNAQPGDMIKMMGPGPKKIDTSQPGWYLFCAEMSGMPAAIAAIEELPPGAEGIALLEITSEQDVQDFQHPEHFQIQWLVHPDPKRESKQQLIALKSIRIPDGAHVFVAGELNTIRKIKKYLSNIPQINRENFYISSYWKIGANDEAHKQAKKAMA
ncbi:MAG: siderophore-interacting protein [Balneolales bacterium]|nr:siderophore-interacting protein [Balneolales bacterium]